MRQPPRQLDVREKPFNPDCMNVRLFLRGEEIKQAVSYDQDAGLLWRYTGKIADDEFELERINFHPEEFRVEWIDPRKAENADLYTDS